MLNVNAKSSQLHYIMYEINKNSLNSFNERQIDWSIDTISIGMLPNLKNHQERCLEIKSNPNNLKLAYIKLKLLRAATVRRLPEPLRANKKLFLFFLFLARVSREPLCGRCCWQRKLEVARHFISTSFFRTYNFIEETYMYRCMVDLPVGKPNYVANNT